MSVGSFKIGFESELKNARSGNTVKYDIAGRPMYSFGANFDKKDSLFATYGYGKLEIVRHTSVFHSGMAREWGGQPVTDSWGGNWSFFQKGSVAPGGGKFVEFGSGLEANDEGGKFILFGVQVPALGGFELVVQPKY